jgi:hypothetical protein
MAININKYHTYKYIEKTWISKTFLKNDMELIMFC